jgi:hypothetical protein
MRTQTPRPAADSDRKEATSSDAAQSQPDPIAISPAIGPLPAIYVPRAPGQGSPVDLLRHVTARVARLVDRLATRQLPHKRDPRRCCRSGPTIDQRQGVAR